MAPQALAKEPLGARASFFGEALYQGKCAVTGKRGSDWTAHHVLYQQHLRHEGLPIYDNRNALRVSNDAHANHHSRARKIRTVELLDCNIDYLEEVLDRFRAQFYLRRFYDDTTQPDPRVEMLCPGK